MPASYQEATVGQLVAERPGRARVFEAYGIDYCCGGKTRLEELEKDMHAHVHKENNILFPRAIALEEERVNAIL